MSTPLLTTKLYIPPLRPGLMPRPRLIERLNAGLDGKLTLVSAPAGFGKTTLLSEWVNPIPNLQYPISNTQSPKTAWLSLDESDNDPARFLAYFVAALQTVEEDVGKGVLSAFRALQPPPVEAALTILINEVAAIPGDLALVLDDYHLISAQPIHEALIFLLDHLPNNVHLIIATRSDPPLHLARLRGRGQLTELRATDLRFRPDEVAAFLNQVAGLNLATDDVAALASRTEGWIAGLQMATLAIRARVSTHGSDAAHIARFIRAFTGSNRFIMDYLVEEVLQQQPPSIQTFLLQTAILDRLSGPLCDAVVDIGDWRLEIGDWRLEIGDNTQYPIPNTQYPVSNTQSILEYLESSNLFIVPLDDEQRWYRYHHLFADLLRQRLRRFQPDVVPELHRRASAWHERHGSVASAIEHAFSAGDLDRAADLVERIAEATWTRGEFATFSGWVEALPDDVVRARLRLCAHQAMLMLLVGRPLSEFESRMQHIVQSGADGLDIGEVAVFHAVYATLKGDVRQSAEHSQRALELLPEDSLFLRSLAFRCLGGAYRLTGDVVAASRTLDEAAHIAQKAGDLMGTIVTSYQLAEVRIMQGQLYEARALLQRARELAAGGRGGLLPIASRVFAGLGMLLWEWNDLQAATQHLLQGIALADKWVGNWGLGGYLILALVRQAQGDADGAREAMQTAERLAVAFDATEVDDVVVRAYQARLWIMQGDLEAAVRWAEERDEERDSPYHVREVEHIMLGQVYVAQGRPDKALALLSPLLQSAERLGRTRSVIEISIVQALAHQAQLDIAQALAALERALSLAEPQGFVRMFVDAGQAMAQLLNLALSQNIAPDYVGKLLAAFSEGTKDERRKTDTPPDASSSVLRPSSLPDPLSEREIEVLRLIAAGLTNQKIAATLVLALGTVKAHTANIYAKLEVHNRTQAVARARALGLL
jgi:LuxR family maltose regulon positive regulatory protein